MDRSGTSMVRRAAPPDLHIGPERCVPVWRSRCSWQPYRGRTAVAQDARSIQLSAPSPEQRRQFLMEEHGYTVTPSPEQRRQFLMEEHGYTVTPSPEQHRQFLMEEHGYD